jgi:BolA protein
MRAASQPGKTAAAKIAVDFRRYRSLFMGVVADAIQRKIRDALAPTTLVITDDSPKHAGHAGAREGGESHFTVEIISAAFEGKSRVARQRLVYDLLKAEFAAGLHALALIARSPSEGGNGGAP